MDSNFYQDDRERWNEINKVREKVAKHLRIPYGSKVLDVLVGHADFSRVIARTFDVEVTAIEVTDEDIKEAKKRIKNEGLQDRIHLIKMDVTAMHFSDNAFDYIVNFIGWEDFTAVSGEEFVGTAFSEMTRVLKMNGILAVTFIPAVESNNMISRKDNELQEYMYKSSKKPKFFDEDFFFQMLEKHGIKLLRKNIFETPKSRLQPPDAKRFIEWFCKNYKNFYAPDVEMRSYEEIIGKFREFIEKYGVKERKSKFVLLIGKKGN